VAAAACELALRLLDLPRAQPVGWAWRGDPAERNELGFRGHRATGVAATTVLLVGDSQVETTRAFVAMPEVLLGATLRELTDRDTRVVSVGARGWGQDQQLLALRQALPLLRPQVVVLWFTPRNDLWNNTFPTHMPKNGLPKPTFWLEGDTLRGPHAAWGTAYQRPGPRLAWLWRKLLNRPLHVTDEEWEPRLPAPYAARPVGSSRVPSFMEFVASRYGLSMVETAEAFEWEKFENEKTHAAVGLTPRSARLDYSIRLTRALLHEMARLCHRHDARFLVFYIDPVNDIGLPEEPTDFEVEGKVYTLSKAAEREVIHDVLAGMSALTLPGYQPSFRMSRRDAHLNDEGNRHFMAELGRAVAPLLSSR
jgi:hypothetical protein